ncbi:hypothetical protein AAE478_003773 [Parahypoxylon ruwenzoriense]
MKRSAVVLPFLIGSSQALLPLARNSNSNSNSGHTNNTNDTNDTNILSPPLLPQSSSGGADRASASTSASFALSFVSYGNYTALPGQGGSDDGSLAPAQLMSMSFAAVNQANGAVTICAFPLGHLSPPPTAGEPATWVDEPGWQACADRKGTDGKHRYTIATSAAFGLGDRQLSVNQTWFCHDDDGRLHTSEEKKKKKLHTRVAYTGIANGTLDMTCFDGGELGGYHVENCTSPDVTLPITLL